MNRLISTWLLVVFTWFAVAPSCLSSEIKPQTEQASASYCNIVNLMPEFWSFWLQAEKLDTKAQIALLRKMIIDPNKDIYGARNVFRNRIDNAMLKRYLCLLPHLVLNMRIISDQLPNDIPNWCAKFSQTFPDMNWHQTIYIMPSLETFNGKSAKVNGINILLFGIDRIADLGDYNSNCGVLFAHEFFHIYHAQVVRDKCVEGNGTNDPLYCWLWEEGLAVYISKLMNPQASLADVLMDKTLAIQAPALSANIAKQILADLDSTSFSDNRRFFLLRKTDNGLPMRTGYYLGMLVAEQIAKKYPLPQLVRLQGELLRREIRESLQAIANSQVK